MVKRLKEFTLTDLLITIVILAILAGITLIAFNPGQNMDEANDDQRKSDVSMILNAIWQYAAKNNGDFPTGLMGTTALDISSGITAADTGAAFCNAIVPTYLDELPTDPSTGSYTDCSAHDIGYTINLDSTGRRVTVGATLDDPDQNPYSETR